MVQADDHHRFDALGLQGRHVQKNVAAHADADGAAAFDPEMIEQAEHVERALPVRDDSLRIGRPAMTAGVRRDEFVFAQELIATRVCPILVGASAAMQQQQWLARCLPLHRKGRCR